MQRDIHLLTLEAHAGLAGLCGLQRLWGDLAGRMPRLRPHHTFAWHLALARARQADEASLLFFLLRLAGEPVAIVPLQRSREQHWGLPVRVLQSPQENVYDVWDIVSPLPGSEVLSAFCALLNRSGVGWDLLRLNLVWQDAQVASAFESRAWPWSLSANAAGADYLPAEPLAALCDRLSRNFRGNLRKARNKLAREQDVCYVARRSEELAGALDAFIELEGRGWKGPGGTTIGAHAWTRRLYAELLAAFDGGEGSCEINELWVGGRLAASQVCLRLRETLYVVKIAHDEELRQLAPGNLLLCWLIDRASRGKGPDAGVRLVNLMTDSPWHGNWKPATLPGRQYEVFNHTFAGALLYVAKWAKRRGRTFFGGTRPSMGPASP